MNLILRAQPFSHMSGSFLDFPFVFDIFIPTINGEGLHRLLSPFSIELVDHVAFQIQQSRVPFDLHLLTDAFVLLLRTVQFRYIDFSFVRIEKLLIIGCEISAVAAPWSVEFDEPFWVIFYCEIFVVEDEIVEFGQIKLRHLISRNLPIRVHSEHIFVKTGAGHFLGFVDIIPYFARRRLRFLGFFSFWLPTLQELFDFWWFLVFFDWLWLFFLNNLFFLDFLFRLTNRLHLSNEVIWIFETWLVYNLLSENGLREY